MSVSRYEPSVLSDSEDGAVDQSYDAAKVFEQQHSGDWKLVCDVSGTRDGRKQVESSIRMGMEALQPQLWLSSLVTFLSAVFLPEGYPSSVSDDYAAYQVWDTLQAFCSSIMGTLSTHAVLKGVGVGDAGASVAAATFTHLLRNASGMVTSIAFAWLKGTQLDYNAKQWRLVADILNDVALVLELVSAILPKHVFLFVVTLASMSRAVVGVAGGATRAALTRHQARANNMADVSAKDGSQETVVNLVALFVSMAIIPYVTASQGVTWTLFTCAVALHLICNYRALRSLHVDMLNERRLSVLIIHYKETGTVLDIPTVNKLEPLFIDSHRVPRLRLGASLQSLSKSNQSELFAQLNPSSSPSYPITLFSRHENTLSVFLARDSASPPSSNDALTCAIASLLNDPLDSPLARLSQEVLDNAYTFMEQAKAKGWNMTAHQLCDAGYRFELRKMKKTQ
eukprot:m.187334 g.187334  ORF g.187334 m.187334 type:complete len:454 (+) comp14773_c0_seq14:108-1469(+)